MGGSAITSATLDHFQAANPGDQHTRPEWRGWTLLYGTRELELAGPFSRGYRVDLERCGSTGELWDWITHVSSKTWCDDATTAGLIRALRDIAGNRRSIDSARAELRRMGFHVWVSTYDYY